MLVTHAAKLLLNCWACVGFILLLVVVSSGPFPNAGASQIAGTAGPRAAARADGQEYWSGSCRDSSLGLP